MELMEPMERIKLSENKSDQGNQFQFDVFLGCLCKKPRVRFLSLILKIFIPFVLNLVHMRKKHWTHRL